MSTQISTMTQGQTEQQFATFYVGPQLMGVDIRQVQEINRLVSATPVPHAPPYVRGVISRRGDVVTVLDLRTILGLQPTSIGPSTRCVVLESDGEKTGVLVDRVADVVTSRAADVRPPPANVGGVDARFFQGVVTLDSQVLVVLDVPTVMSGTASPDARDAGSVAEIADRVGAA